MPWLRSPPSTRTSSPERFPREKADATIDGATWASAPSDEFETLAEGGEPSIYVVTVDRSLTIASGWPALATLTTR